MAASRVFDVEDAPAPPGQTSTPTHRSPLPAPPPRPEQDVGGSGENLLGQRRVGHDRNVTQAENGHRHDRSVPTDQSQHPALATRQVGNRVGGREGRAKSTGAGKPGGPPKASGACSRRTANAATPTTEAQRFGSVNAAGLASDLSTIGSRRCGPALPRRKSQTAPAGWE